MPLNFITFKNDQYPIWQSEGNAARWVRPLQDYLLSGHGLDIGYSKEEWRYPAAMGIDPAHNPEWHAMKLPDCHGGQWDYITSSHMLEHLQENWMTCLDYWLSKIRSGGMLLLYIPHNSQTYWKPENNRKHVHSFDGSEIKSYLQGLAHKVFVSGCDFNHSFVVVCEKV